MSRNSFLTAGFIIMLAPLVALALAPDGSVPDNPDKSFDHDSYIDANAILMMVYNTGNVAYDNASLFGKTDGWHFPYTGHPEYPGHKTAVYCAGIWLGGKVGGDVRVAVAEYGEEFVPGYMLNGSYVPDNSSFRVYKLDSSSGPGDPDYDEWPADQGAPVDDYGDPLLLGDQTLWAVYNDADPGHHLTMGTDPLGVEVQQTVWASRDPGEQVSIYILYKLYNKGENEIDSFFVSFWADPDLGDAGDDLVGCDTSRDVFFCYNDGLDDIYGTETPAWGGKVLSGLVVPSPGDTGIFAGNPMADHRNLPAYAFSKLINGADPQIAPEVYDCMRGLDRHGNVIINPTTGLPTRFMVSGDPVTATGWIDESSADKRTMITLGPVSFNPGDSQQVALKLAIDVGSDPLNSVNVLKSTLDSASSYVWEPLEFVECDSATVEITDYAKVTDWYWDANDPRWVTGVNRGGTAFFGSVENGVDFFGSNITDDDLYHTVEIRFSQTNTQNAYRYLRGGDPNYGYTGYYDVPFTVWDVEDNRQLTACFVENNGSPTVDFTWGPCDDWDGCREYLFIMNSDYSDVPNPVYDGAMFDLINVENVWDNLYFWMSRLVPGHTLSELNDGQTLGFVPQRQNPNGFPDSILFIPLEGAASKQQSVTINSYSQEASLVTMSTSEPSIFSTSSSGILVEEETSVERGVSFTPPGPGIYGGYLDVRDMTSGRLLEQVRLVGMTPGLLGAGAIIEPDTMFVYWGTPYLPADTVMAKAHVGNFEGGYYASSVNMATIRINGVILPFETWLTYHPDFDGEVVALSFKVSEFVRSYGMLFHITEQQFHISGEYYNGETFLGTGSFVFIGRFAGDVDGNGVVEVSDAVYLLSYIFAGGDAPDPIQYGDTDCNGIVEISDAVYLITYIFNSGTKPCTPVL